MKSTGYDAPYYTIVFSLLPFHPCGAVTLVLNYEGSKTSGRCLVSFTLQFLCHSETALVPGRDGEGKTSLLGIKPRRLDRMHSLF